MDKRKAHTRACRASYPCTPTPCYDATLLLLPLILTPDLGSTSPYKLSCHAVRTIGLYDIDGVLLYDPMGSRCVGKVVRVPRYSTGKAPHISSWRQEAACKHHTPEPCCGTTDGHDGVLQGSNQIRMSGKVGVFARIYLGSPDVGM